MAKKNKILIVDDEAFFRELLKDLLSEKFDIVEAEDGIEVVSLVERECPDIIILDIEMPGKNGIDVCVELKSNYVTRAIPVIMVTSRSEKEELIAGLNAGADDYVTKPINQTELLARIDAHLRRSMEYYSRLEKKDLLLLIELSELISASRNPLNILDTIVDKMSDVVDVARCSIVSADGKGGLLVKASSDDLPQRDLKIDMEKYPEIEEALRTKDTVVVDSIKDDPLMRSVQKYTAALAFDSIVVAPIVRRESIIGTLFLRTATKLGNGANERVVKLCTLVANISANALENALLFESMKTTQFYLEELALRDGLTNLYNHNYFYARLDEEFARARRYNNALSCIFIDIDNFKTVNDRYGHLNGDVVLCEVANLVHEVARESDLAARYGGEEFVILLPNTQSEGAMKMAKRLHSSIRASSFKAIRGEGVTVSVGVATFENDNMNSIDQLVQLADSAMYRGKKAGKDQVVFHEAKSPDPDDSADH
ncbi:MAG: diguanylate cyclase [Proteobacteria bacterium]|nr:diguanylate cyclase [Pseudomonadota bacterium]